MRYLFWGIILKKKVPTQTYESPNGIQYIYYIYNIYKYCLVKRTTEIVWIFTKNIVSKNSCKKLLSNFRFFIKLLENFKIKMVVRWQKKSEWNKKCESGSWWCWEIRWVWGCYSIFKPYPEVRVRFSAAGAGAGVVERCWCDMRVRFWWCGFGCGCGATLILCAGAVFARAGAGAGAVAKYSSCGYGCQSRAT